MNTELTFALFLASFISILWIASEITITNTKIKALQTLNQITHQANIGEDISKADLFKTALILSIL